MRRVCRFVLMLPVIAIVAGLIGCGSSKLPPAVERLPGKWRGEMIVYDETQAKLPAEQVALMAQMQYDFEFRTDGTMALTGVNSGQAFTSDGRWQTVNQEGEQLVIKSTEQSGKQKDIKIEFDGRDTFYIPVNAPLAPGAEVAELGAMRFTRLR